MQVRNQPILLKDGTKLDGDPGKQHHIRAYTFLRYRKGSTSLMRVDSVEKEAHGYRLYGMNILGDYHAAYAHDCVRATKCDMMVWKSYAEARRDQYLQQKRYDVSEGEYETLNDRLSQAFNQILTDVAEQN